MASELPMGELSLVAHTDLRLMQYHIVRLTGFSADLNGVECSLCGAGLKPVGILQNAPNINTAANVMVLGKSQVVVGAAANIGDSWIADANGHAIPMARGSWVGGQFYLAAALSATPTGAERSSVLVECLNPWWYA